jgi:hypothetical protein
LSRRKQLLRDLIVSFFGLGAMYIAGLVVFTPHGQNVGDLMFRTLHIFGITFLAVLGAIIFEFFAGPPRGKG